MCTFALAALAACTPYKVVDYPSALDEPPTAIWLDWDDSKSRVGKKSEAEWLAKKSERAQLRHARLKETLTDGYGSELVNRLPEGVDVIWGEAPADALRLDLSVKKWVVGAYVPNPERPRQPGVGSVPTVVQLQVDFVQAGEPMESIEIRCWVEPRLWTVSADHRFHLCGAQLGKAVGKYFEDRASG